MPESIDPTTGETVATYEVDDDATVVAAIETAHQRHLEWRTTSFATRADHLHRVADALDERRDELAALMAAEMGKPVTGGRGEVDKCAWVCRWYADNAAGHLADEPLVSDHDESFIHYEPLGVVLAVMPWNFPLWQVFRFAAPALMAGNGGLLKHASNVTGCAIAIQELIEAGGVPEGLFRTLILESSRVDMVLEHPLVRAATLTGSGPAGSAVAAKAGELLKPTVLELGGSDPYVVLEDADLDLAAAICAKGRIMNGGQSCIAAKRFIVVDAVHDEFVAKVTAQLESFVVGDPSDEGTDMGPMARVDLRDELHDQVERTIAAGATLVLGGEVPDGPGAFYPVTLLPDVTQGMPGHDEETFGPIAVVVRAADEADAVEIANDTPFGLGAAVFTADLDRGRRIAAEQLDAGCCFVNAQVASDPRLPFGGIKESGYGRELSHLGIREFVNAKTVAVH